MSQDINTLNEQFGIAGKLTFIDRGNDFIVAEIVNDHCSAAIALSGAHLLSWQPNGEKAVIWMSEHARFENGKSIRGGVPVCWPWFGAHSCESSFPAHGFARTTLWQVASSAQLDDGRTTITFALETAPGYPLWPFATRCELNIRLGTTLEMSLTTHNNSNEPIIIGQALHTYFAVGDIRSSKVRGLDNRDYLDKPTGFTRMHQQGDIGFTQEVDRVYLNSEDTCLIDDSLLNRSIRIEKSGSRSTIVWNPWAERAAEMGDLGTDGYLNMVCVESANAAEDVVAIAPGASHTLAVCYSVQR